MVEGIVTLVGLCLTFLPALIYFNYLLNHVNKKTRFDYHLELIKDKKGTFGVVIAYMERILFGMLVCDIGILMSEFFQNEVIFIFLIVILIMYVIVKYIDINNEK